MSNPNNLRAGAFCMLILVVLFGITPVMAFNYPKIVLETPVSTVKDIAGRVSTQWQIKDMAVSVMNSNGQYLQEASRDNWTTTYAVLKPDLKEISYSRYTYIYQWSLPLGFTLPKDNYRFIVTINRPPNLVFKQVLPVQVKSEEADEALLVNHIKYLASPELQGRAPGTPGGNAAARYIAEQFSSYGLQPGGTGGWYQYVDCFKFNLVYLSPRWHPVLDAGHPVRSANVIGVLPGETNRAIIVSAHYDHLGAFDGGIFYGANDNASGIAVLLETARILSKSPRPQKTIIFAAWTGEEQGLIGSDRFAGHCPAGVDRVINLDTVGNNAGQLVVSGNVKGFGDALERAAKLVGVKLKNDTGYPMYSDDISFARRGIPAVNIYSPFWLVNNHAVSDGIANVKAADLKRVADYTINLTDLFQDQ